VCIRRRRFDGGRVGRRRVERRHDREPAVGKNERCRVLLLETGPHFPDEQTMPSVFLSGDAARVRPRPDDFHALLETDADRAAGARDATAGCRYVTDCCGG
jgi:hypothetical protein